MHTRKPKHLKQPSYDNTNVKKTTNKTSTPVKCNINNIIFINKN